VKKIVWLLLIIWLFSAIAVLGEESKTVTEHKFATNTVYFDSAIVKPGEQCAVKAYLFNIDTLAGMQVPIFYRSETIDLYCDSVSFVDSRCGYMMFTDIKIPENEEGKQEKVVYFSFINTIDPEKYVDPLLPGEGLIATIYFTAPKDASDGVVPLTRGMIPHPQISFIFSLWDAYGDEVDADFVDSKVIVKK
jgi:hypothetical protein